MTYIVLNNDMQLSITKLDTIYRGDNLNTSITFLIPAQIDNVDMETAKVFLSSIRADGEPDMVILERLPDKYDNNHYKYVLPVTCKLSRYPGKVCMWLQFCDGESCHQIVAKSSECTIRIHESTSMDGCLHDHQLTAIFQLKKQLEELCESSSLNEASLKEKIDAVCDSVAILNEASSVEGSVDYKIAHAIASIIENPDEAINSINEIVAWCNEHAGDAIELTNQVTANKDNISALELMVGDTAVSKQIESAVLESKDYANSLILTWGSF